MVEQLVQAFKSGTESNLSMTLEALLPQYRGMVQTFYRSHDPSQTPIAANGWLHRELIARFGAQEVLSSARKIEGRLRTARRGVLAAMRKEGGHR
ncbi:MAG: hypothetical protein JXA21_11450 [Anaerolineae bacterium]|nr:hypothetical protein [Anaerolineae bacterium]